MNEKIKSEKIGKIAASTICKNEIKYIEKWMDYASLYSDYQVILDTGSTDGSFEKFKSLQSTYKNLIVEQKIFTPWRFDVARNYNHTMIPKDVSWCLQMDMDEYFSINTLDELEKLLLNKPDLTNMSCARLDIYSSEVFVGQPKHLGSNKIFRFGDYRWKSRIYEHLSWIHKDRYECEIYNPNVFLIHDQDYKKPDRADQYLSLLTEVWKGDKTEEDYDWVVYFLVNHYFREQNLEMFIRTACDYIPYAKEINKKEMVIDALHNILNVNPPELTNELKSKIEDVFKGCNEYAIETNNQIFKRN